MLVGSALRLAPEIVGAVWKLGAPDPPVAGPAKTEFCAALLSEKVRAGVVVAVATELVNNGERFPAEKLVTLPPPAVEANVPPLNVKPEPTVTPENPPDPFP